MSGSSPMQPPALPPAEPALALAERWAALAGRGQLAERGRVGREAASVGAASAVVCNSGAVCWHGGAGSGPGRQASAMQGLPPGVTPQLPPGLPALVVEAGSAGTMKPRGWVELEDGGGGERRLRHRMSK